MSEQTESEILPGPTYECVRCGTRVIAKELAALPSPRCLNCGFTVFVKVGPNFVKQVKAV